MRQICALFLVLMVMSTGLTALPSGDSGKLAKGKGLSHRQVVTAPWISAGLYGTYMLSQVYCNEHIIQDEYWIETGMLMASHLPMYWLDPMEGLLLTASFSSLVAIDRYTRAKGTDAFYRDFIRLWPMEHALYSTYAIYKHQRLRAAPGIYNDNWRLNTLGGQLTGELDIVTNRPWKAYGFTELMLQPFDGNNLSDPFVFILPIAAVLGSLLRGTEGKAIWNTGKAYIGRSQVNMWAAIPAVILFFAFESAIIATTEDAFFRGFVYEEVGHSHGQWWAKGADMAVFPLFHVPGEISRGYSGGEIAMNFLRRSALTFYLDILYDGGGLGRSVAAHFWIDFSLFLMGWLMKGGVPQDGLDDLLIGRDFRVQVGMPF